MHAHTAVSWDQQKDVTNITTKDPEANFLLALEISS